MKVKTLIDSLSVYPDTADIVVVNEDTLERSDIEFITWKNSAERVNIYYKSKNGIR